MGNVIGNVIVSASIRTLSQPLSGVAEAHPRFEQDGFCSPSPLPAQRVDKPTNNVLRLLVQGVGSQPLRCVLTIPGEVQVYISIKELIPTALKYDPHNKVVSSGIVGGMVLISASLLLFTI